MSIEPAVNQGTFCLACSAVGEPGAASCWLCGSTDLRKLGPTAPVESSATQVEKDAAAWYIGDEVARPRPHSMPRYVKPVVALIGVLLAVAFLIGVWQESPGMAIVLASVIAIAIRATVGRTGSTPVGKTRDPSASAAGSILRIFAGIITIAGTVFLIVVVGAVAMFVFALISCFSMLSGKGPR
jgi:ribosomal protein L40E